MKINVLSLLFVLQFFNAFGQDSTLKTYELFFKVKAKYAVNINAVNRNVDASNEMPYLNGFINKHKIKVEKIEKSFISPKNKDLKNIIRLKISETRYYL